MTALVTAFFRFWYDLIVGDSWRISAGIAIILGVGVVLMRAGAVPDALLGILLGAAIMATVPVIIWLEIRATLRPQRLRQRQQ